MYLRENSIKVWITYTGTQFPWAHGDDSVNFPDTGIWPLKHQTPAAVSIAHPSTIRPSGTKGSVSQIFSKISVLVLATLVVGNNFHCSYP